MKHFYQDIHGWFDFDEVYLEALGRCKDGARMAEVGVYLGKSLFFLAVEIVNSKKAIQLIGIDKFNWPQDCFKRVQKLRDEHNLDHVVTLHQAYSVKAASAYENESFDFVFIDAEHDFANVRADINAWWPKVKRGGVLAGHDWCDDFPGVEKAVIEKFTHVRFIEPQTWWVEKK